MEWFISMVYWLILLYIGLSLVVLFFILTYKEYALGSMRNQEKKRNKWRRFFETSQPELSQQEIQSLKDSEELIHFNSVIQEYIEDANKKDKMRAFVYAHEKVWVDLSKHYENQSLILRAYYAACCKAADIRQPNNDSEMIQMMQRYALFPSIYCRNNALGALYTFGNVKGVVDAFQLLSEKNEPYHVRLVSEGLSEFKGDKRELVDALYKHFDSFRIDYQVGIIDFFRKEAGHLKYELKDLLKNPSLNKELVCALMRYYKKHPVQEYKPLILAWMSWKYRYDWEIIAVTASTLAMYPGEDTINILQKCLPANNWFIRKNAAISLERLNIESAQVELILDQEQLTTIDQLTYELASKELM